jgi:hypothetical protein
MLQFCREQASPAIQTIVVDIERSRNSEEGLDLASLAIPPIGGDLANGDAFLLWDALGRESNCPSLISILGLASDDSTRVMIAKKMKTLNSMSRDFAKDIKRAKKKVSMTARLCALLSGGKRSSSSSTVDQTVEEAIMMGDDSLDISSSSSVCDSSRQAMELVVNADVAVDMSQLSQLSLVDEVNDTMEDATTGITLI